MGTTVELEIVALGDGVVGGDPAKKGEELVCVNLAEGRTFALSGAAAMQSTAWDIAFKRSVIWINGGKNRAGQVAVACVFDNDALDRDSFLALTPESLKAAFDRVDKVPAGAQFAGDGIWPAVFDWWRVRDGATRPNSTKGWKLRLRDGASFAKMKMEAAGDKGSSATFAYCYQPSKDAPLGPKTAATLHNGQSFRFSDGKVDPGEEWDMKLEDGLLLLNGGESGAGKAGALGSGKYGGTFDDLKSAGDSIAYFMDEYGAPFREKKWYRYNMKGNHKLHLGGNVYIVRTPGGYYKFQVFDYFEVGESVFGRFRIRFSKL